jgi:hypothetical protein
MPGVNIFSPISRIIKKGEKSGTYLDIEHLGNTVWDLEKGGRITWKKPIHVPENYPREPPHVNHFELAMDLVNSIKTINVEGFCRDMELFPSLDSVSMISDPKCIKAVNDYNRLYNNRITSVGITMTGAESVDIDLHSSEIYKLILGIDRRNQPYRITVNRAVKPIILCVNFALRSTTFSCDLSRVEHLEMQVKSLKKSSFNTITDTLLTFKLTSNFNDRAFTTNTAQWHSLTLALARCTEMRILYLQLDVKINTDWSFLSKLWQLERLQIDSKLPFSVYNIVKHLRSINLISVVITGTNTDGYVDYEPFHDRHPNLRVSLLGRDPSNFCHDTKAIYTTLTGLCK